MGGNIQSGLPWSNGVAPVIGEGWVQFGGAGGKKIFFDELSKADQDLVIQYLLSAQFPVLIPPQAVVENSDSNKQVSGIAATVALQTAQGRHDIIIAMLDSWIANNQKIAEESKRADEKKRIEDAAIVYQEVKRQEALKSDDNFPIFAVGMIIAGTGLHQAVLADPTLGTVQINPMVNMYSQVLPPVMGDMRAELGLIGAFFATGIQYFTAVQVASETTKGKGGDTPKDALFAKGYAENVISLLGSGSFNNYLLAIVTRSIPGEEPISPERVKELMALVKVVLLASALAMLYITEAGKMTGLEFAGMLNGNIKFADGDLRAQLVGLIKSHLKQMNPKDRETLIGSLLEYFDGNPSIESLSDPAKVFSGIYGALPQGELAG